MKSIFPLAIIALFLSEATYAKQGINREPQMADAQQLMSVINMLKKENTDLKKENTTLKTKNNENEKFLKELENNMQEETYSWQTVHRSGEMHTLCAPLPYSSI